MLEVPKSPTVYTTIYDGFKGVDYTNDMTSVYKKRSPDAVNIMPDESGNPVKRFGWETVLTQDDLKQAASYSGDIEIYRCYYFTLSGVDHIMIFTSAGLFCYKDDTLSVLSTNGAIVDSVDRAFYFEGNGDAAFYIYGGFKVWKYTYTSGLVELAENEVTVPNILIANSADGGDGEMLYEYNLLGTLVGERFINNGDTTTTNQKKVTLARNITQDEYQRVKVFKFNSNSGDYDISLTVYQQTDPHVLVTGECRLLTNSPPGLASIEFFDVIDNQSTSAPTGEDTILVQYPVIDLTTTTYPPSGSQDIVVEGTASLVRG